MLIFKDNVSGSDKKHILWQHYINNDYFFENETIKIHNDPGSILPTKQGNKAINLEIIHEWLNRIIARLPPDKQVILRAIYIENAGTHALYDANGKFQDGMKDKVRSRIRSAVEARSQNILRRLKTVSSREDNTIDDLQAVARETTNYMKIAESKASVENILKGALQEKNSVLTSTKEKATLFFSCLVGFASGSVPGISLGALGYTLVFGFGFALAATPVGWLIGGAALCGLLGAIAVFSIHNTNKKHDDEAHRSIYAKGDIKEKMAEAMRPLVKAGKRLEKKIEELHTGRPRLQHVSKNTGAVHGLYVVRRLHRAQAAQASEVERQNRM